MFSTVMTNIAFKTQLKTKQNWLKNTVANKLLSLLNNYIHIHICIYLMDMLHFYLNNKFWTVYLILFVAGLALHKRSLRQI